MANTKLTRNMTTQGSSIKGTFSAWVKRSKISVFASGVDSDIYQHNYSSDYRFFITFNSHDKLRIADYRNGWTMKKDTTMYFRDTNAWYHIYVAIDRSLATAGDRTKLYINGERYTNWSSSTDYSQQTSGGHSGAVSMNNDYNGIIGGREDTSDYFDGLISHLYWVDGSVIDIAQFGETDSTTGEWKIKTNPTIASYGTNGHSHFKDVASVNDASPNSNNFTLSTGNLTKTEDNPSNVFATWNPLDGKFETLGGGAFTYGNNKFNSEDGANKFWARSTLGMTSGKYYFEMKVQTPSNNCAIGISDRPSPNFTTELGAGAYDYSYQSANSGNKYNNGSQSSYGNTYTTNDIVSCALDLDNLKVYFGKNGTWQNSGDPTSGSTGTGAAFTVAAPSSTDGGAYFFCGGDLTGSNNVRLLANFGNGIFADNDPVSSAGTNASNNGIFEYDVPTGYTALSTKGLNS